MSTALSTAASGFGTSLNYVNNLVRKSINYITDADSDDDTPPPPPPTTGTKSLPELGDENIYNLNIVVEFVEVLKGCDSRIGSSFLECIELDVILKSGFSIKKLKNDDLKILEDIIVNIGYGRYGDDLFVFGLGVSETDISVYKIDKSLEGLERLLKMCEGKRGGYWGKKREGIRGQKVNLEKLRFQIKEMEGNVDVVESLKEGCRALKQLNEKVGGAEGVEKVMDEVEDVKDDVDEIGKALGGMNVGGDGGGEEEDDLNREIEELERAMREEEEREVEKKVEGKIEEPEKNEKSTVREEEEETEKVIESEDTIKRKDGKGLGPPLRVPLPG